MGLVLRRVCRGCGGLFPNEGSLFTHGYCRECWRERRSQLVASGAIRCAHLPPDPEPVKPSNGQLGFAFYTDSYSDRPGACCPIKRKGGI